MVDPDIPTVHISEEHKMCAFPGTIPYDEKRRVMAEYGLSLEQVMTLFSNHFSLLDYFEDSA